MLQVQEQQEPSESEVIRLAQRLYEQEQTTRSRKAGLIAAAEEVGIPAEYMAQATAQLKARESLATQQATRRLPVAALIGIALATWTLVVVGYSFTSARDVTPPPPGMVPRTQVGATAVADPMSTAYVHLENGNWNEAEHAARQGIAATPNVADLHWALGKALYQRGNNEGALAAAQEAMRLNPRHTSFPLLAGEIHLRMGKLSEAKEAWERVLALDAGKLNWDARTAEDLMRKAGLK